MEQRVSIITLGVAELARSKRFYEHVLGWKAFESNEKIIFFDIGGMVLSLYEHKDLVADINATPEGGDPRKGNPSVDPPSGYRGMTLAHNLRSPREVDTLLAKVRAGGGKVIKSATKAFWGGYSGYFSDPDGHIWEVAHNPFWPLDDNGQLMLSGTDGGTENRLIFISK